MNMKMLNHIPLDGDVIIKRGAGSGTGGGGGELEGEYYLARPNGWYWKATDKFLTSTADSQFEIVTTWFMMLGTAYEVLYRFSLNTVNKKGILLTYRDIGTLQAIANNEINVLPPTSKWLAIAEGGKTKIDMGEMSGEYNSIYEASCALISPMTEEEFEAMMLSEAGLQRITKEEYESLITE